MTGRFCGRCGNGFSTKVCRYCHLLACKAWKLANPDKVKASKAIHRKRHPERMKAKDARYYAATRDKSRVRNAAIYKANRLAILNRNKTWYSANPEHRVLKSQNRRGRKAGRGELSKGIAERLLLLQRGLCACCGLSLSGGYELDHIMPLALGGSNTDENIQLLRPQCNAEKHAKHPVDFMQSRGFLL